MTTSTCLFCRIAAGDVPSELVFSDEQFVAFLDHRPLFAGHCLLVPRAHVEALSDLPTNQVGPMFLLAQRLEKAIVAATTADGSFLAINNRVSQSVPHLHLHLVPRRRKDGLKGFFWPRQKYPSPEAMTEMAARIRSTLAGQPT